MLDKSRKIGVVMFYPCLFCPRDMVLRSRCADAPPCAHFSIVFTPSWIPQQISVETCVHQCVSAHRECQTMFKIVTWTKQTWTKHHNTEKESNNESPYPNIPLLTNCKNTYATCNCFIHSLHCEGIHFRTTIWNSHFQKHGNEKVNTYMCCCSRENKHYILQF